MNKEYYNELTPEKLDKFILELEEKEKVKKQFIYYTNKYGAIEAELTLLSKLEDMCSKKSKEEKIKELKKRREQLELELEEGLYKISSDISNPFIQKVNNVL